MPFMIRQTEDAFLFTFAPVFAILQWPRLLSLTMDWMRRQTARFMAGILPPLGEPPPLQHCHCLAAVSSSGHRCHPRRRQNSSDEWWRDHDATIMANLPTHLHHSHAVPQLMGGILMLGERGVMVTMGHGLCVFFYVWRDHKK
jgi:hypothetical protein